MANTRLSAKFNVACVALLLAMLGVVNVYRARTQSITYDEAVTYDAFVVGPMSHAFTGYNANNHVLFTILAKLTTGAIGTSERARIKGCVKREAPYLSADRYSEPG